ncbi:MAG: AAA family ATPase [Terracidiphilus sp.]
MRKLTVKNFSVIKEAPLEFGKITILIGPQASGKSLLCKLAYFLSKEILDIAVGHITSGVDFAAFEVEVKKQFVEWFPRGGWGSTDWLTKFASESYEITVSVSGGASPELSELCLNFSKNFKDIYEKQLHHSGPWTEAIPHLALRNLMGKGFWDQATYVPSERSYFVDTQKAYRLLESQPDPIARRFAVLYSDSLNLDFPKPRMHDHLEGELKRGEGSWQFAFDDGRILPLSQLSSGSKEMLPLLSALAMYEHRRPDTTSAGYPPNYFVYDEFFIEEPEAHIFPEKQLELVRYFVELTNDGRLRPTFAITTHSPYILSAFGNLLKAGKVGAQSAEHHAAVEKTVPEKYWINNSDFAAYKIENGMLESIFDKETGQIDGDYLDDVSSEIAEEFGQLLEIQYGG